MKIQKKYRKLEDLDEISIHNVNEKKFYNPTPKEFEVNQIPVQTLMDNLPLDIHTLMPHNKGEDFIIQSLGNTTIKRGDLTQKDVQGRLLSKISPAMYEILKEYLQETYQTHKIKKLRFKYYHNDKIISLTNAKIIYDMERIFVMTDHIQTTNTNKKDEEKANMIEYLTQSANYTKTNGKYTWTQGIYYILERNREKYDEYYNIIFDMAINEDKPLVEKIIKIMDTNKKHHEENIRIKTANGKEKTVNINIYSKFNEKGELINQHGTIKDITQNAQKEKIVDFMLNGFKNSEKLALLVEPLNTKQYEFSNGFYHLIEETPENYHHSRDVIRYIQEEEIKENIIKIADGKITQIDETFTYNVKGDENKQKICDIYIERFEIGGEPHSIGFITDTTEETRKQKELQKANEHQIMLIKEVHHRVKNNLQILNSFLRLEKRVYKENPHIIIDHMQSRLNSLALLHEKTYSTEDFKNINLNDYLQDQDKQYRTLLNDIEIHTKVDETINLQIEVITPLSLIIDELTMNAIKHAFPDKNTKDKQITKQITKIDINTAKLILKDNGVGIKDIKAVTKNLGCEIIKSLTRQLNGEIKLLKLENGTGYELTFPMKMKHTILGE